MRGTRTWGVRAAALAVALVLSGCGTATPEVTVDGADALRTAARAIEEYPSLQMTMTMRSATAMFGQQLTTTMVADGRIAPNGDGDMLMTTTFDGLEQFEGVFGAAMEQAGVGDGMRMRMLVVDGIAYSQGGGMMGLMGLEPGKTWVSYDATSMLGDVGGQTAQGAQLLAALEDLGETVEDLGEVGVNDLTARRWRYDTTLSSLLAASFNGAGEDAVDRVVDTDDPAVAGMVPAMLDTPVTGEVWIGPDDFPYRLTMSYDMGEMFSRAGLAQDQQLLFDLTIDLRPSDQELTVVAPDPATVQDGSSLFGGFGGEFEAGDGTSVQGESIVVPLGD